MKLKKLGLTAAGVALALGVGFTATLSVGQMAPFGNDEDTSYAASLWTAMVEQVQENGVEHLAAITVMFKREDGYDAENKNWFWAKYLPDGSLDKNPKGMQLAGRVAKGNASGGCIACHSAEADYLYTTNAIK